MIADVLLQHLLILVTEEFITNGFENLNGTFSSLLIKMHTTPFEISLTLDNRYSFHTGFLTISVYGYHLQERGVFQEKCWHRFLN